MNDFDDINQSEFEGYVSSDISKPTYNSISFDLTLKSSDYTQKNVTLLCVAYNRLALVLEQTISRTDRVYVHASFASDPTPHFIVHKLFVVHKKKNDSQHSFSE